MVIEDRNANANEEMENKNDSSFENSNGKTFKNVNLNFEKLNCILFYHLIILLIIIQKISGNSITVKGLSDCDSYSHKFLEKCTEGGGSITLEFKTNEYMYNYSQLFKNYYSIKKIIM